MEPLKPETVQDLLKRPQVTRDDIAEYQRLLSERFTSDPDIQRSPQAEATAQGREARIKQLHAKLFGAQA